MLFIINSASSVKINEKQNLIKSKETINQKLKIQENKTKNFQVENKTINYNKISNYSEIPKIFNSSNIFPLIQNIYEANLTNSSTYEDVINSKKEHNSDNPDISSNNFNTKKKIEEINENLKIEGELIKINLSILNDAQIDALKKLLNVFIKENNSIIELKSKIEEMKEDEKEIRNSDNPIEDINYQDKNNFQISDNIKEKSLNIKKKINYLKPVIPVEKNLTKFPIEKKGKNENFLQNNNITVETERLIHESLKKLTNLTNEKVSKNKTNQIIPQISNANSKLSIRRITKKETKAKNLTNFNNTYNKSLETEFKIDLKKYVTIFDKLQLKTNIQSYENAFNRVHSSINIKKKNLIDPTSNFIEKTENNDEIKSVFFKAKTEKSESRSDQPKVNSFNSNYVNNHNFNDHFTTIKSDKNQELSNLIKENDSIYKNIPSEEINENHEYYTPEIVSSENSNDPFFSANLQGTTNQNINDFNSLGDNLNNQYYQSNPSNQEGYNIGYNYFSPSYMQENKNTESLINNQENNFSFY